MAEKAEIIHAHKRDGSVLQIVVPKSSGDVEMQQEVPVHVLALLAFSPRIQGKRRWSEFTRLTLRRLEDQYGSDTLRLVLMGLLDDIQSGFHPENPVGVFIHRVRATATTNELTV